MKNEMDRKNMEALIQQINAMLDGGPYASLARKRVIGVFGLGGAGANILASLHSMGLKDMKNVETIAINSDERVLDLLKDIDKRVLIGKSISEHPRGTSGDSKLARRMIEAARESLMVLLKQYQIVILLGSLGGGTGSELMIVLSKMAVDEGKVVMAIPVLPFSVEGSRRAMANRNMSRLEKTGAMVVPLDNDSLTKDERMRKLDINKAFESLNRIIFRKIKEIQDDTLNNIVDAIVYEMYAKIQEEMLNNRDDEPKNGPNAPISVNIPQAMTADGNTELTEMGDANQKPI
jgi:cell division GTPase FtsZ